VTPDEPFDPFADADVWSDGPPTTPAPAAPPPAPERGRGPRRPGRNERTQEPGPRRGPRRPGRPAQGQQPVPAPAGRGAAPDPGAAPRRQPPDDDYVDLPAESRVPRWLAVLLVLGVVLVAVVGGGKWWYDNQVDPPGEPGETVTVVVPEGATARRVANLMADEGVISNAMIFNFWVNGRGLQPIQAGSYEFRQNVSFGEAVEVLNAGPGRPITRPVSKLTIPEGLTIRQTIAKIAEDLPRFSVEELQGLLDRGEVPSGLKPEGSTSYEGLLFPATYDIDDDATALEVLTQLAMEMDTRVAALGIDDAATTLSNSTGEALDSYDLLVVASLVQEEAGSAEEAPKIARVIYNRLASGWALGIDATSQYLAELEGTSLDFTSSSPYNTRRQVGLPPTPIASPGEYALEAALRPAEGPWMYYVLTDPGVHTFTVTDAEFQAAKRECIAKDLGCG
jgi:UPF0755 protein